MTRKSKRELERALESLDGGHGSVREWVEHYIETAEGIDFVVSYGDEPDHAGEVCVMDEQSGFSSRWVPAAYLPEWINPEEDLTV